MIAPHPVDRPELAGRPIHTSQSSLTSALFNTVITQVPLPELNLTLAGARLSEIYPVVPLPDLDQLGSHLTGALTELLDA